MEKQQLIEFIANAINEAGEAAKKMAAVEDGGTCNMDHVTIRLKGFRLSDIDKINSICNYPVDYEPYSGAWWKGHRPISFPCEGMANRRYAMARQAYMTLNEKLKSLNIDGIYCSFYQQMD